LLEDPVRGVARLYVVIYGKFLAADRAIPDFVIALPLPITVAIIRPQDFFDPISITCHAPSGGFGQADVLFVLVRGFAAKAHDEINLLISIERIPVQLKQLRDKAL